MASLLHENIEYKIWRWDDFKCFTLTQTDFVSDFNDIQEKMMIRSIIPYELYSGPQSKFIAATYV